MKKKTLVCSNVLTSINSLAYSSHAQEWFRMGRSYPEDDFILYNPHRTSIDRARNEAAKMAMDMECDYLYFIDDDMILSPNTYKRLRDANKDIVMAHTIIRGYPFDNMMFIDPEDKSFSTQKEVPTSLVTYNDFKEIHPYDDLIRVDAIGCACALFEVDLFKELEFPYFVTLPNCTEDVFCCMRMAKRYGRQKLDIYVHLGVPTGHIMDNEVVASNNREKLKVRAEEDFPEWLKERNKKSGDRGDDYANKIVQEFEHSIHN